MNTLQDYKIHELAQKVPAPSAEDYAQLKKAIERDGQEFPIIRCNGEIIDGRTRLKICIELGLEPRIEEYTGSKSIAQYVLTTNIRRNLTKAQRHQLLADFAAIIIPQVRAAMKANQGRAGQPKNVQRVSDERPPKELNPGRKAIMAATGASSQEAIDLAEIHSKAPELLPEVAQRGGLRYTAKEARRRAGNKPIAIVEKTSRKEPRFTTPTRMYTPKQVAECEARINTPSIYPEDLPLPIHPTDPQITAHIQEAIIALKKNESRIGELSRKWCYSDVWVYTQRIQSYAYRHQSRAEYIDPRWAGWAKSVAGKVRAREAICLYTPQKLRDVPEEKKLSELGSEKLLKEWQSLLKRGLKKMHFAPDQAIRLIQMAEEVIITHFEERRTPMRPAPSQNGELHQTINGSPIAH